MSIKKWIAKKGAVGGTARWVGEGYHYLVSIDPNVTTSEEDFNVPHKQP